MSKYVNVSSQERLVSIIAGGLLLFDSIANKRFRGFKAGVAGYLLQRGITGNCRLYSMAGKPTYPAMHNINIRTEIYINKERHEVYAAWRKLENLPRFMKHLVSVREVIDNISEWKASIPGTRLPVQWRAVLVQDVPGEVISWHSLPDSLLRNAGKIEFQEADDSSDHTIVRINLSYQPTAGLAGDAVAEFLKPALEENVREDVYRFKEYVEAVNGYMVPA